MTCTHIQDLLPLFVGGDLKLQKADSVRAHLFACQDCSTAAADYEASQSWLASSTKPDFDDQFFENLRDSVWRDIRTEQVSGPRISAWTWIFATAMVAIICIGLVVVRRGRVPQGHAQMVKETPDRLASGETNPRTLPAEAPSKGGGRSNEGRSRLLAVRSQPSLPVMQLARHRLLGAMPLTPVVSPPPQMAVMETATREQLSGGTSPILRRMEIQTSDPTIRIIWLVADESTKGLVDLDINE